jgi:hypothetical protein
MSFVDKFLRSINRDPVAQAKAREIQCFLASAEIASVVEKLCDDETFNTYSKQLYKLHGFWHLPFSSEVLNGEVVNDALEDYGGNAKIATYVRKLIKAINEVAEGRRTTIEMNSRDDYHNVAGKINLMICDMERSDNPYPLGGPSLKELKQMLSVWVSILEKTREIPTREVRTALGDE